MSFTATTKKIKYLGIDLTRNMPCLYKEIDKTLLKDIKVDWDRWEDILSKNIPCSYKRWINIIKMPFPQS